MRHFKTADVPTVTDMTEKHNARDQITENAQTPRVPQPRASILVGDGDIVPTLAAPEAGQRDFYSGIKAGLIDALSTPTPPPPPA